MIWGYGPVGYGGYRTKRVLTENGASGQTLAAVAGIARDQGGPAAFEWLARPENRLRHLGVAFATKYLFFCAANGRGQPALVLDRLVRSWMSETLGWPLSLDWDVEDYREYVAKMSGWAAELNIEPGNLEMLVFQLAANGDPQSLWSAPDLFAVAPSELISPVQVEASEDALAIIAKLDEAAAMFADQSGATEPEDTADFNRGVRALKRIVLTTQ
jgi:8-oxoguanine DNA glycosylase-like protein